MFLSNYDNFHIWPQNWPHYVWNSSCQVNFLWTSSIVKLFDFLTLDILYIINCLDHFLLEIFWHIWDIFCYFDILFKRLEPVTELFFLGYETPTFRLDSFSKVTFYGARCLIFVGPQSILLNMIFCHVCAERKLHIPSKFNAKIF